MEELVEVQTTPKGHQDHGTAGRACQLLVAKECGYVLPTRLQRDALLVGFAMHRMSIPGAAYDLVRLDRPIDLNRADTIAANIDAITLIEVKSTNRASLKADFKGYFFNITGAELLAAQSLRHRYLFVLINVITGEFQELTLAELMGKARGFYPAWHIRL